MKKKMILLFLTKRLVRLFLPAIFLLTSLPLHAGKYAVSNIPDSLKENARAVIREHDMEFRMTSLTRARLKERRVITILDKRGESLIDIYLHYDSFSSIRNVSGTLYDENGSKIRDLRKNEFTDRSNASSFTLYADSRVTYTDIYSNRFPVTIEYEFEMDYRNAFFPPHWFPQNTTGVSVQEATYTLHLPAGTEARHKFFNTEALNPASHNLSDTQTAGNKWYVRNLKAIKVEPYMPPVQSLVPYALVALNDFSYGGYRGSMNTWNDFGRWIAELNKGKQKLPQATIDLVKEMVKDTDDPLEKARIVYEYVQERTRYVSINLGIGGLQPFDAETVDRTGYGDCKALSNYTQALLQEVGVKSYYSIIRSGSEGLETVPGFPANLFNHVIVCVPHGEDTLWLETTSKRYPAGYIGSGNSNRPVLMITEEGGILTRTPHFARQNSFRTREVEANLKTDGSVQAVSKSRFEGSTYEWRLPLMIQGQEAQKRYYLENLGVNAPVIDRIDLKEEKSRTPFIREEVSFETRQYASRAGNRLFFEPNLLAKGSFNPPSNIDRTHDLYLTNSPAQSDTVIWALPQGYTVAHVPPDVIEDSDFGYYEARYELLDNTLKFQTSFYTKRGQHSPERYPEFAEFFRKVFSIDRAQLVLIAE